VSRRTLRRLALGLLGPLISLGAIIVVLRSVDVGGTVAALGQTELLLLIPCLALVAAGISLRALRWQQLLPSGRSRVSVGRIAPVLLVGYLGNAVLPARLGEPIRAYLLARRERLSSFEVLGTALLERILDVAVLAIMAFAAAALIGAPAWVVELTGVAAGGGLLIIGALITVGLGPVVRALERVAGRANLAATEALLLRLDRFAAGFGGASQRLPVARAAALCIPIWLVDTSICLLAAQSLGAGVGPAAGLLIVAVGALGTSVPSAPGYVGTYELAASAAARAMGMPPAAALSLAILIHAVTLLPVALAGAAALVTMHAGNLLSLAGAATERGGPTAEDR